MSNDAISGALNPGRKVIIGWGKEEELIASFSSVALNWGHLCPASRHLAVPGEIFGCHNLG